MATRPAFVLPEGLELELTEDTISIRYAGDLRLETTLGRAIGEIYADGDIELLLDKVTGTISAGGKLTLDGEVDAEVLHGREIVLGGKKVKATAISAAERIRIGAAVLSADCIIAPNIELDPKVSGRVTVIESKNDRGASKIKGGFSLADYDDMFGNAADFLLERGLEPLADGPAPALSVDDAATPDEPSADEEDVEDPLSLSIDDIEEIVDQSKNAEPEAKTQVEGDDDVFVDLRDAMEKILGCYEGADVPPAVSELQLLVEQGEIDAMRENITEVWNGLLSYHQKRGIRPHHQVTHAFNMIHSLIP